MSEPRYYVATVTGYRTAILGSDQPPGLSAHVLDRFYNCRVVATYRSEDKGGRMRVSGAPRYAEAHAARLNATVDD